jgi:WD40 repeat protein
VTAVAFSENNEKIAIGFGDKTVYVLDAETGQLLTSFAVEGMRVDSIAVSPNGKTFLTGLSCKISDLFGKRIYTSQGP